MELGLHPKRQKWSIERFILHGWPWGENSSQITAAPEGPQGLSIWRKLLLAAAYKDVCHVTLRSRATDHYRLECLGFMWHGSGCCRVNLSSNVCAGRKWSKLAYMLMTRFHYCQYRLIPLPVTDPACVICLCVDIRIDGVHVPRLLGRWNCTIRHIYWIRLVEMSVDYRFKHSATSLITVSSLGLEDRNAT